MSEFVGKHTLIIVENLPVPFDRRVWQEATSLKNAGMKVSVICPKMKEYMRTRETIDGIEIYRHHLPSEGSGVLGYTAEYATAIAFWMYYSIKIFCRSRFHVIHGCNPPDLVFLIALLFKPFGVKYLFDHHDINPELYRAKFDRTGFFYKLMRLLERCTFSVADRSLATNESYRSIAINRGKMSPDRVHVVRSGPKLDRLQPVPAVDAHKHGRRFLVGYVGVIGEQEGLDLLLEAVRHIVMKRQDIHFGIVGGGTELANIKQLAEELGVSEFVTFYGRAPDNLLLEVLSTADVCVNPDRPTEMNNLSTMNKIMEYMALGKPIVQFDLKEGRFSAQSASLYADSTDPNDFAEKILSLIDNPDLRKSMGNFGRNRVISDLSWEHEEAELLNAYRKVLSD